MEKVSGSTGLAERARCDGLRLVRKPRARHWDEVCEASRALFVLSQALATLTRADRRILAALLRADGNASEAARLLRPGSASFRRYITSVLNRKVIPLYRRLRASVPDIPDPT